MCPIRFPSTLPPYSRKPSPFGANMSICAKRVSRGVHNIAFSLSPDRFRAFDLFFFGVFGRLLSNNESKAMRGSHRRSPLSEKQGSVLGSRVTSRLQCLCYTPESNAVRRTAARGKFNRAPLMSGPKQHAYHRVLHKFKSKPALKLPVGRKRKRRLTLKDQTNL